MAKNENDLVVFKCQLLLNDYIMKKSLKYLRYSYFLMSQFFDFLGENKFLLIISIFLEKFLKSKDKICPWISV
jgi:hypothetical protein